MASSRAVMMRFMPKISSSSSSSSSSASFSTQTTPSPSSQPLTSTVPPLRTIPGSYGLPLLGAISDRLDYFWFQGPETFMQKRKEKYQSTVFRTNIPPTFPFFLNVNPQMIVILDCKAFSALFDMDLVEKKNVLIGDFMPSTSFTGNMRVGVYLDTTEPQHSQVKELSLDILKRSSKVWASEFLSNIQDMWTTIESEVKTKGKASLVMPLQKSLFRFLSISMLGADPRNSPEIAEKGHVILDIWLALQLLPTQKIGRLQPLEEILIHSFAYPFALIKSGYNKLYEFVKKEGRETVQRGVTEFGLTEDEVIHNLLFVLGFNAFGGFTVFLPTLIKTLGTDKTGLQEKLRKEVRDIAGSDPVNFETVKKMELVQSFIFECLRYTPPVRNFFARARKDFVLNSQDSSFQVKKGELLYGYQPMAMRDPNVFEDPESFVPDRFMTEKGKESLNYLYWCNGPHTGIPSSANKQCSGKDHVVWTACMLIADLYQRYDSITVTDKSITAFEKAK